MIKQNSAKCHDPRMQVAYLEGEISSDFYERNLSKGSDVGGISRDYLDILTTSFMEKMSSFFVKTPHLHLPKVEKFSKEIETNFKNLGNLFMYCFLSRMEVSTPEDPQKIGRQIGQHFDPSLFSSLLSLKDSEIDLTELYFETKIKICQTLIESRINDAGQTHLNWLVKALQNVNQILHNEKDVENLMEIFGVTSDDLPLQFIISEKLNIQKIIDEQDSFKEAILSYAINQSISLDVQKMFLPIHAIAKGMKEVNDLGNNDFNRRWTDIQPTPYHQFSDKVQGCPLTQKTRNSIADNIVWKPGVYRRIDQDVGYLKDWIIDPKTSQEDIRLFLKFTTGSTSPQKDQILTVKAMKAKGILPIANTCELELTFHTQYPEEIEKVQNHRTEEERKEYFIKCFKKAMKKSIEIGFSLQ